MLCIFLIEYPSAQNVSSVKPMYIIHILPLTGMTQWYNGVQWTDAKNISQICWFLPSIQFPQKHFWRLAHSKKKCFWRQLIWPNFSIPLTLQIFLPNGYAIKKSSQHSIIWRWAVLCKKKDGGRIKICETFSGNSLKEDLSIDTTFDPLFRERVPLKFLYLFLLPIFCVMSVVNWDLCPLFLYIFSLVRHNSGLDKFQRNCLQID